MAEIPDQDAPDRADEKKLLLKYENPPVNLFQNEMISSQRIIYTASPFAKSSLLYLQECGTLQAIKPHVSSRSNLSSYLFFVVMKGSGQLEYDGMQYELKKGDCVFLSCREGYEQSSSEDLWSLKWVHFTSGTMSGIWNKYCERGGKVVFHPQTADAFTDILKDLYDIASAGSYVRDVLINQKLTDLVTLLMKHTVYREGETRNKCSDEQKVGMADVKSYIDTHYKTDLSLESLASRFYFHKSYLARLFKETYGTTVNGYIALVRVGKAKELLRFTDKSIRQCGCECGYEDQNYFSRMFKRVEGCSPSQFREYWRTVV